MSKLFPLAWLVTVPVAAWAAPQVVSTAFTPEPAIAAAASAPAVSPAAASATSPGDSAPAAPSGLVVKRSFDGLFYVDATVNGAPVRFIVDSGSSVVILSAADAARASVGGRDGVAVETAGGGTSQMRRATIERVALAGRVLSDVDAAVVDRDLKVSLLGQSALSQLGSVTFKGDRLELD